MSGPTQRGIATPEGIIGLFLGFLVLLAGFALAADLMKLGRRAALEAGRRMERDRALQRLVEETAGAGIGVCSGQPVPCTEESVELLAPAGFFIRADLDRDDPEEAAAPELLLGTAFVPTGNDEVVGYLVRPPRSGGTDLSLDADFISADRTTTPQGEISRRDGVVERVDLGRAQEGTIDPPATLYRVTFVHDARWFGSARFRVAEPFLDEVRYFHVEGRNAAGETVADCGGADDAASKSCRCGIRMLSVTIGLVGENSIRTLEIPLRHVREAGL